MQQGIQARQKELAREKQAAKNALAEAEAMRTAAGKAQKEAQAAQAEVKVAKAAVEAERRVLDGVQSCIDGLISGVLRYIGPGVEPDGKPKLIWGPASSRDKDERHKFQAKASPGKAKALALISKLMVFAASGSPAPQETDRGARKADDEVRDRMAAKPQDDGRVEERAARKAPQASRGWER